MPRAYKQAASTPISGDKLAGDLMSPLPALYPAPTPAPIPALAPARPQSNKAVAFTRARPFSTRCNTKSTSCKVSVNHHHPIIKISEFWSARARRAASIHARMLSAVAEDSVASTLAPTEKAPGLSGNATVLGEM